MYSKKNKQYSVGTIVAIVLAAMVSPVFGQGRLSLSERVARLEAQAQNQNSSQTTVDLLNQISQLQEELQNLRGLAEQQAHEIEQLKSRGREQYLDLDSRVARLEGSTGEQPKSDILSSAPDVDLTMPADSSVENQSTTSASGQLVAETPEMMTTTPQAQAQLATDTEAGMASNTQTQSSQNMVAPATSVPNTNPVDEKTAYENAFAALREGRYADSANLFAAFLEQYPNGEFADNANYWLGESYYVTQNYRIALDTFNGLLSKYPQSAKTADAQLKVAYCYYELGEWSQAEQALNLVIQKYPDTTVARLAQGRLRALHLENQH